ncbi:hypothetical protein OBBRIDRAFT_370584 [Obba rivulosa]|uniref:Uncharacterized protein n=1 Tax=Obba rivulosa TaxID=1052685 RepID=A0A8E2B5I2_9APHY|nr:hypothetical protein OBBRIDRAFT_370584 [Obba rivulosa]
MTEVAVVAYTPIPAVEEHLSQSALTMTRHRKQDPVHTHRDPHKLPSFSDANTAPILYLPPLLSSLPRGYRHAIQSQTSKDLRPKPLTTSSRLPSIDQASLALHRALHHFQPTTSEYASIPYAEAFNWPELELTLPLEDEREWYCVAFRSKRRAGSDAAPLYEADKKAHEEAVQNGGLIMYWYGSPHPETGLNLATCIWQSRAHAAAANSRPHHVNAMRLAAASYERYDLERYRLCKVRGERGVKVLPYDKGSEPLRPPRTS